MSILVTGGAGYIGSHMVALLVERGFDVIVADNLRTGHWQAVKGAKALALTACDIFTSPELQKQIKEEFKEKVPFYTREQLGYHTEA